VRSSIGCFGNRLAGGLSSVRIKKERACRDRCLTLMFASLKIKVERLLYENAGTPEDSLGTYADSGRRTETQT